MSMSLCDGGDGAAVCGRAARSLLTVSRQLNEHVFIDQIKLTSVNVNKLLTGSQKSNSRVPEEGSREASAEGEFFL